MRKYLSCVILILLCLVCAMVFYANASALRPPIDDTATTTTKREEITTTEDEAPIYPTRIPVIEKNGTILSEYFCSTNLRVEWSVYKYLNEDVLYLSVEVYLDSPKGMNVTNPGYLEINGEKTEFKTQLFNDEATLVTSCTKTIKSK